MVITIDGPAGVGKTTTAKRLANKLGYQYLDTGAMYRAVTYFFRQNSVDISSESQVKKMLDILNLELDCTSNDDMKLLLDNKNISSLIRSKEITNAVSKVSALQAVRERMVKIQKNTAKNGNFIVEGRDIGTVVFPDAKYKFFLVADYDTRAKRRLKDFKRVNEELNVNKIKQDLTDRDQYDSSRKLSPLKQANDAIVIDTSNCTIDDQVNQIYKHIERN
ncbi:MAG: cytidylate kinase [Candidatus Marinimicrobia bacterium]|nr:cytidylate kinase [Candidatus Neomarinimicrobiota bacterium]|tara:strand:- start:18 stop:677 length:660 start_codon:yes stop_codon:yes gene_type:complete